MGIPDAQRAVVTEEKVRDYLLNFDHPDGGSKGVWFHSLGYVRDQSQLLGADLLVGADLLAIARGCDEFDTETTQFGVRYKAAWIVGRPDRRPGRVLTVWIVEEDDPPRLVTAYPDEDQ